MSEQLWSTVGHHPNLASPQNWRNSEWVTVSASDGFVISDDVNLSACVCGEINRGGVFGSGPLHWDVSSCTRWEKAVPQHFTVLHHRGRCSRSSGWLPVTAFCYAFSSFVSVPSHLTLYFSATHSLARFILPPPFCCFKQLWRRSDSDSPSKYICLADII